mgnify:CR=1 FL=1
MADYYDGSMLRTWATFKFSDVLLENKYYSADCTHVELYINGEFVCQGPTHSYHFRQNVNIV